MSNLTFGLALSPFDIMLNAFAIGACDEGLKPAKIDKRYQAFSQPLFLSENMPILKQNVQHDVSDVSKIIFADIAAYPIPKFLI